MKFEKHIFISYAHDDNQATPSAAGWVTRFQAYLEPYLSIELGEGAQVWRDDRLRGNDLFANEIVKQFPKTAVVVSVLSRHYLKSEWCLREVNEFSSVAAQKGGPAVEDKSRIFAIGLRPVPPEERGQLPGRLNEALGYPFYREVEGKRIERLDPEFGSKEMYCSRIAALAADIAEMIRKLEAEASVPAKSGPTKPVIYLAEGGYDREEERENLLAELRTHGYTVVPERVAQLSDVESRYVAEVSELLSRCQLSIHVVGAYGGKTPDGPSRKSVVELQARLAAQQSAGRGLRRIIWMPEGTRAASPDLAAFLEEVQRSAEMQRRADLITGSREECKAAIRTVLQQLEAPKAEPTSPSAAGTQTVYLVCVEQDLEAAAPLVEFLAGQGLGIEFPIFTGEASQVREMNEAAANRSDAFLLFFGAGDGLWKLHQQSELTRLQNLRRERPTPVFTYLAAPKSADKTTAILRRAPHLIDGIGGFSAPAMEPFLAALRALNKPAALAGKGAA